MAKQIKYADEARQALLAGINAVSKAVVTTLGPKGRNVALDKKWGAPSVIHDGVSVAKEIELADPFENMGAQLVKEASSKTNDNAGDGTTTSTLLARAITEEGMKAMLSGVSPMDLRKEIEEAVKVIIETIEKEAKPVKGDDIRRVAIVSAQDEVIGGVIADAIDKVGKDGVVTVEEGRGLEIKPEYKEGMEFDRGYASAYFVTNPERMEAEIADAYILLTDKKISSIQELLPFLEKFVKVSRNLVIIADELEGEALATLVVNKLKGTFNVLAIKAPGFGDRRKELLADIATLTGGTVISEDTGRTFETIEVTDLGQADKVWADKDNARIIGGAGDKKELEKRISLIRRQIDETTSEFDREKLEERLAKLVGGVAVINVGAATEVELNEKKERVKDAVGATKAAMEGGIVAGGGVCLFEAREALVQKGGVVTNNLNEAIITRNFANLGAKIIYQALSLPLRTILENALGLEQATRISGRIYSEIETNLQKHAAKTGNVNFKDYKFLNRGFNVMNNAYGDMFEEGIVDPAKVVISALQNAASVAAMVLTTEALVADIPEEKKDTPSMPGGMDGMM